MQKNYAKLWVLRHLRRSNSSKESLVEIYREFIRPIIEYASVVYGPLLNGQLEEKVERLQKTALRLIFGKKTYARLLEDSKLENFSTRRTNALKKFAEKNIQNSRFSDSWFPLNKIGSCLLYTSPSPRDRQKSRMPSSA